MSNQYFAMLVAFMLGTLLFMGGSLSGSRPTMVVGFGVSVIAFIVGIVLYIMGASA